MELGQNCIKFIFVWKNDEKNTLLYTALLIFMIVSDANAQDVYNYSELQNAFQNAVTPINIQNDITVDSAFGTYGGINLEMNFNGFNLDGNQTNYNFTVDSGKNFTIKNIGNINNPKGFSGFLNSPAIHNEGSLRVENSVFTNNKGSMWGGTIQNSNLGNIILNSDLNLRLDANLALQAIDTISMDSFNLNGNNINISHINILQPTTLENFALSPLSGNLDEASKTALAQAIQYTGDDLIYSPIFKYSAEYDPKSAMFNFTRLASGARPQYDALNPGIMASSVASQLGGYLIQLNSYDEAFKNMDMYMLMSAKQRQAMKFRNKYATSANNAIYDSTILRYEDKSGWFRPYAFFENVPLKSGPKVSNTAYGTFFGTELQLYELKYGWDCLWGVYGGYNGSHQSYDGV